MPRPRKMLGLLDRFDRQPEYRALISWDHRKKTVERLDQLEKAYSTGYDLLAARLYLAWNPKHRLVSEAVPKPPLDRILGSFRQYSCKIQQELKEFYQLSN